MGDWITTLAITFVFVALAMAALAIGWLLTGKSRLKRGCGSVPQNRCEEKKSDCSICGDK